MNPANYGISNIMFELFDHAAESIAVAGLDGRFVYVNLAGTVFGGKKFEEMVGKVVWEVYPDIAGSLYEQEFWRAVREQIPIAFEYYFPTRQMWFEVRFYPSLEAVAIFGIDITAQKQAEEERQRAEEIARLYQEKYQLLIEAIDEGFALIEMVWDANGNAIDHRFLEVNPGFERMSGLANATGKTVMELVPGFELWWVERFGQVVRTGEAVRFQEASEVMGRVFDVFASAVDSNRLMILFTDVTARVHQQQERDALNEALMIAAVRQQEITEIADDLNLRLRRSMQETHHRVKNNLQVIMSLVEMQAAEAESDAASIPLLRINQHIQTLAVIHDLLTQQVKIEGDADSVGTQAVLAKPEYRVENEIDTKNITGDSRVNLFS